MVLPSISTSPVEKLRWKFVQSSCALYRHHSTNDTSDTSLSFFELFLSVIISTSQFSPFGTIYKTSAERCFFSAEIFVYPNPWRHSYLSSAVLHGCQPGFQIVSPSLI